MNFRRTPDGVFVIDNIENVAPLAPRGDDTIPEILMVGRGAQNSDIRRTQDDVQPYQVQTNGAAVAFGLTFG